MPAVHLSRVRQGATCAHWAYLLRCEEYDELWTFASGRCQLCDIEPQDTKRGVLFVDHDGMVGQWAVRGLLCGQCNADVEWPHRRGTKGEEYLVNPYYHRLLIKAGLTPPADPGRDPQVYGSAGPTRGQIEDLFPEPVMGAVIDAGSARPYGSIRYRRDPRGWQHLRSPKHPDSPISWEQVLYQRGPHRLKVLYHERNPSYCFQP